MSTEAIIWQYWETRQHKPPYIDLLHEIAAHRSGARIELVTPDSLHSFLHDVPTALLEIEEIAHKADMIRAMLVHEHGGMWLDSDALVVRDLLGLFELLESYEFVGFEGPVSHLDSRPEVKVNCFLARPGSKVVDEWVRQQHQKLPRTTFAWTEIGSDLLDPIVRKHSNSAKLLPFDLVSPIRWYEVDKFFSKEVDVAQYLHNSFVVMLSNKTLHDKQSKLVNMSRDEILGDSSLIGQLCRGAGGPQMADFVNVAD